MYIWITEKLRYQDVIDHCLGLNFVQLYHSLYLSLQFKYIVFHIFSCILHYLWVYYKLTMWPALSCLIAQLVEHWTGVTQVMVSNPIQTWIYHFQCLISQLLKLHITAIIIIYSYKNNVILIKIILSFF